MGVSLARAMGVKTLLLVEDDSIIMMVLEDFLASAGFEVTTAIDGNQALGLIEQDASRFAAVLTDIRLGSGPDGWKVAARARELAPDIPVVYMTGDSAHEWSTQGAADSLMLLKPLEPADLVKIVASKVSQTNRLAG